MTENSEKRAWIETLLLFVIFSVAGWIWPARDLSTPHCLFRASDLTKSTYFLPPPAAPPRGGESRCAPRGDKSVS